MYQELKNAIKKVISPLFRGLGVKLSFKSRKKKREEYWYCTGGLA